ncbi:MAG: T9SS type A sorting domain-containing protein [Chitinophagaceae bacterium]|nr:T9SS type A sorting domain-containing protein [Bacteroidota bacterium]MBK9414492.1 T9SS type A sorting domain-containing protein [Bacteroidota bacterium]MBP6426540.1 T9SS type A sorting domain-containing protein [Bacteroidia bacterium]MBP6476722.1 T9SS type A sorting domain-containing protein [Chitinophagaceae bacterium]
MKRIIIFIFLLGTFYYADCQPQFFERTYGFGQGAHIDNALNGNYIIGANTGTFPNNQAYNLLIDGSGDTIRTMSCLNLNIGCIRQTQEGGFVFIGDSGAYPSKKAMVYKTDSIGNILWYNSYPSDEWGTWGSCISLNYENGFFIGLVDDGASSENTYYIVKVDSSGNNLDTAIVQYPQSSFLQNPNSIQVTPDSGLVVATSVPIYGLTRIVKFDSNLNTQWDKVYIDTTSSIELNGNSINLLNNNGYLVTGYTTPIGGGPGACGYLLKIDQSGDSIWSKEYCFSNIAMRFISSAEDTLGNFYISGEYNDNTQHSLILIKANSIGDIIWTRLFSGYGYAFPKCLILDNDQNPMVVGYTKDTVSNQDYIYLLKTDTSGNITSTENYLSENKLSLNIYPNPVHSILSINSKDSKVNQYSYKLRNVFGQIILNKNEKFIREFLLETIDLSFLPNGLYFLETMVDGHRNIDKIVKY